MLKVVQPYTMLHGGLQEGKMANDAVTSYFLIVLKLLSCC
jgi:hypothetical protein